MDPKWKTFWNEATFITIFLSKNLTYAPTIWYYFLAEVTDEFAPDTPEDTFENRIEAEAPPVKAELYSICDNNHWVHLFSDQDVKVECILTEQVNYLFFLF